MYNTWDSDFWSAIVQIGILLVAIMVGNVLRKTIPFVRKSLLPSAVIGGLIIFAFKFIPAVNNGFQPFGRYGNSDKNRRYSSKHLFGTGRCGAGRNYFAFTCYEQRFTGFRHTARSRFRSRTGTGA